MKLLRKLTLACCVAALAAAPATFLAAQTPQTSGSSTQPTQPAKKRTSPVDINSATSEELQTLKGIDSDAADKIIQNRPYSSITQLVSKGVLTNQAYKDIRDEIAAVKPASSNTNTGKKNNNNNRGNVGKGNRGGKGRR